MNSTRYPLFDWLRLGFALLVVINHGIHLAPQIPSVAAFVCLSGFLIPVSFDNSRSWSHFAWKRVLRVAPAFILSLALVASLFGTKAIPGTLQGYVTLLIPGEAGSRNAVLWSLALEECLYAFHGSSRLIRLWSKSGAWACLTAAIAVWTCLALVGYHVPNPIRSLEFYFLPVTAFFFGNVIVFYRNDLWRVGKPLAIALALGLLCLTLNSAPNTLLHSAVCVLLCGSLVVMATFFKKGPAIPDLSYGLYVYHLPILLWVGGFGLAPIVGLGVTLSLVVPLAFASWYLIERPALKLKGLTVRREPQLSPVGT